MNDSPHATREQLDAELDRVRRSPADGGEVRLIVRRPAPAERELLETGELSVRDGLVGDNWKTRGSSSTPDGAAHPGRQLTLMNAHAAAAVARSEERWPLAGDQFYVDLDLSEATLRAGTRLALGSAVIEVTEQPHTGCRKFVERFGIEAMKWISSPAGRELRLRGINARVVEAGSVSVGDRARRIE